MKLPTTGKRAIVLILLVFSFTFCSKSDDTVNTDDPANLIVEVLSIDHETAYVEIQATAENTKLYQLYIESSDTPEEINDTGYFEYTFDAPGTYEFTIRAYGSSGRYLKSTVSVKISPESDPVPLSRGYYSSLEYPGYAILWQDEFNGTAVNSDYWGYDLGTGSSGWGNNELQYYRAENSWVDHRST